MGWPTANPVGGRSGWWGPTWAASASAASPRVGSFVSGSGSCWRVLSDVELCVPCLVVGALSGVRGKGRVYCASGCCSQGVVFCRPGGPPHTRGAAAEQPAARGGALLHASQLWGGVGPRLRASYLQLLLPLLGGGGHILGYHGTTNLSCGAIVAWHVRHTMGYHCHLVPLVHGTVYCGTTVTSCQ